MQKLIVLRGAPSSGKSTIAKKLRNFKQKVVWLKVDNFKDFFSEESPDALRYTNESAVHTLSYLFDQKFSVVMEGVFQDPKYITQAVGVAKKHNVEFKVFELDCSLKTLQHRDKNRAGIKEGCRKPLGDILISNLFNVIKENSCNGAEKLDTGKLSLEECVSLLKKEFSN